MAEAEVTRAILGALRARQGRRVGLAFEHRDLEDAVAIGLEDAGAEVVATGPVEGGAAELAVEARPPVPSPLRALIERVEPGGRLAVWLPEREATGAVAAFWGPVLDLQVAEVGEAPGGAVVSGRRRPQLDAEAKRELRKTGHHLDATVLIGRHALSPEAVANAREHLERHGLVKMKLTPQAPLDKEEAFRELAWGTGGQIVQRVGRTAVLYRPDVPTDPPRSRRG